VQYRGSREALLKKENLSFPLSLFTFASHYKILVRIEPFQISSFRDRRGTKKVARGVAQDIKTLNCPERKTYADAYAGKKGVFFLQR